MKALSEYRIANVRVARSLVALNISQATLIAMGLGVTLLVGYQFIVNKTINVGDFVMLNAYIIQIYMPLNFLGTFWRLIR